MVLFSVIFLWLPALGLSDLKIKSVLFLLDNSCFFSWRGPCANSHLPHLINPKLINPASAVSKIRPAHLSVSGTLKALWCLLGAAWSCDLCFVHILYSCFPPQSALVVIKLQKLISVLSVPGRLVMFLLCG